MPRGGARPGAGRKKKIPGMPHPLPMRLTALAPPRQRAIQAREHAQAFLDSREDALIAETWTTGTLRDRLELYRFLKPYAHGVAKLPAESRPVGTTFEEIMMEIAENRRRAESIETTAETVRVEQVGA
jgi:hypothetical protein